MKRFVFLLSALALCLLLSGCESNQHYYERAQRYLGSGDYGMAAGMFRQLGEYADSADYALYCLGLKALAQGDTALARSSLTQVAPFKSSQRYLAYLDAQELLRGGKREDALRALEALGAFADCPAQAAALRNSIRHDALLQAQSLMETGAWEQAEALLVPYAGESQAQAMLASCREGIRTQALAHADGLMRSGDLAAALDAFSALGDSLEAAQGAMRCREALFTSAEEAFCSVSLATAPDVMAAYRALGDYLTSSARLDALEERFGLRLELLSRAESHPFVRYGRYADRPVTWRVVKAEGGVCTLLCVDALDTLAAATATDLIVFSADEALLSLSLPAPTELPCLPPDILPCTATAYAVAGGVLPDAQGKVCWWLDASPSEGERLLVEQDGTVTSRDWADFTVGFRPIIRLSLELLTLTGGSGTPDDPYQ